MNAETPKVTFGFWLYLMSDCVLFAGLFATFAVLRGATFGAAGVGDFLDIPFVLTETMLLLTSSLTIGLSLLFARANNRLLTLAFLAATLALGFSFLGMEVSEFGKLIYENNGPNASAALSSFFTLVGTHGLHVLFGTVWMLVVMAHVAVRGLNESTNRKLTCLALFWHFLDLIWIFIFTIVYLFAAL
ncbi:MAG TPA: cytochrome o ubiquinol oxidase subunit III [Candidatus Paceibacterota bacterium]|nr:cytochrome o ubiquinol oxidase subunit III [Candidatus Paceibacterota bacterium]